MSDIIRFENESHSGELRKVDPAARGVDIRVRLATPDDFGFIDALQKAESDKVGFMYEQAIRKRIEQGNVLVAEATGSGPAAKWTSGQVKESSETISRSATGPLDHSATTSSAPPVPVGYCMGVDRYQKRSELGIIYQMAVVPEYRRRNVAAALLQAQFDKSAYGCRLYCCWCKQSLEANRFWEAMGFVPLAFRAAGRTTIEKIKRKTGDTKGAIHVFWQKPVRQEDVEAARRGEFRGWWYPYETSGGAMMESRVILPLPPEVGWDEATPVVLPGAERREQEQKLLEAKVDEAALREREAKKRNRKAEKGSNAKTPRGTRGEKAKGEQKQGRAVVSYGFGAGSGFGEPAEEPKPDVAAEAAEQAAREAELLRIKEEKDAAKAALKAAQRKSDPEVVAFARELRDRWQECVADRPSMLEAKYRGKYTVGRALGPAPGSGPRQAHTPQGEPIDVKRLDAA